MPEQINAEALGYPSPEEIRERLDAWQKQKAEQLRQAREERQAQEEREAEERREKRAERRRAAARRRRAAIPKKKRTPTPRGPVSEQTRRRLRNATLDHYANAVLANLSSPPLARWRAAERLSLHEAAAGAHVAVSTWWLAERHPERVGPMSRKRISAFVGMSEAELWP